MKNRPKLKCVIVGTETLRGKEILDVLGKKEFPLGSLEFFDPDVEEEYSKLTQFRNEPKVIHRLDKDSFLGADLVFLAADKKTNLEYGLRASGLNIRTIDLSETFNAREEVPLIVAGVNDGALGLDGHPLIANPHPATILLSHIFDPIIREFGLVKAVAFVLQPASAFEKSGIEELASQSVAFLGSSTLSKKIFKEQVAFNLLSHTEKPDKNGFSPSELQVLAEIKRVLGKKDLPLSLSIVQAPIFHTYSIMTYFELAVETSIHGLQKLFKGNRFFKICPPTDSCPVSPVSTSGKDEIFIGQIKREEISPRSFWVWSVADNLTLGSALNAYEIARVLFDFAPSRP